MNACVKTTHVQKVTLYTPVRQKTGTLCVICGITIKNGHKNTRPKKLRVSHTLIYFWQPTTISTLTASYWFSIFQMGKILFGCGAACSTLILSAAPCPLVSSFSIPHTHTHTHQGCHSFPENQVWTHLTWRAIRSNVLQCQHPPPTPPRSQTRLDTSSRSTRPPMPPDSGEMLTGEPADLCCRWRVTQLHGTKSTNSLDFVPYRWRTQNTSTHLFTVSLVSGFFIVVLFNDLFKPQFGYLNHGFEIDSAVLGEQTQILF